MKIVHVPQGRSANLTMVSLTKEIEGLYTWGFSSCGIIAIIGQEKLMLIHADSNTSPQKIIDEINSVEDSYVIFIYRSKYQQFLTDALFNFLHTHLGTERISKQEMDDQHDGVLVSFNGEEIGGNEIGHPSVRKFPILNHPQNLIYHSQEQFFLAVQKIEQLIGLNAFSITKERLEKSLSIFDGENWLKIPARELSIDDSHAATKEELDFLKKGGTTYIALLGKLTGIVNKLKNKIPLGEDQNVLIESVAFYLEGYLNKYDALFLFRRNLLQLLNKDIDNSIFSLENPSTQEDEKVLTSLNQSLKKTPIVYEEVKAIFSDYEPAPESEFKKQLLKEFNTFDEHYRERVIYPKIDPLTEEFTKEINSAKDMFKGNDLNKRLQQIQKDLIKKIRGKEIISDLCCSDIIGKLYTNEGRPSDPQPLLQAMNEMNGNGKDFTSSLNKLQEIKATTPSPPPAEKAKATKRN